MHYQQQQPISQGNGYNRAEDPQYHKGLPAPGALTGPLTELDSDNPDFFKLQLDSHEVQGVQEALASFKALEIHGAEVSSDNFPLPTSLAERLGRAAVEIHQGRGLCLIQGLNPADFSDADNLVVFLGLASYIGDKRGVQDKKGNVITHVTDAKTWTASYNQRHGIHTNMNLPMHCDMGADILALQVRQTAARGGSTYVASSWRIYDDLLASNPRVAETLSEPNWPIQVSGKKNHYVLAPLIDYHDGKLMVSLDPGRLGLQTATGTTPQTGSGGNTVPALTPAQNEALAIVGELAAKHRVRVDTKAGDILFINNWAVLHGRDAYVDDDNKENNGATEGGRRHILRLWLRNSKLGWKIPASLRVPWEAAFGYYDGDSKVSSSCRATPLYGSCRLAAKKYAVMPASDYEVPKYTAGSAAFVIEDSDEGEAGAEEE